jgi:hypothetical protein
VTHQQEIVIAVGAFAVIGLFAVVAGGRRKAKKAAMAVRETGRAVSLIGRVLITAGVIAGGQYLVIRFAHNNITLLVCVLVVPALLAAATTVRALTLTTVTTGRKGHHR